MPVDFIFIAILHISSKFRGQVLTAHFRVNNFINGVIRFCVFVVSEKAADISEELTHQSHCVVVFY